MGPYRMEWFGEIVPYVRTTQKQKWVDKRYKRYQAWKDKFRLSANTQDFPSELDPKVDYLVSIKAKVVGARRWDLDNVFKGVLDALFTQDQRVAAISGEAEEYAGMDWVEVELIERGERVTSSTRRASGSKPVRPGRKAVRRVGGSLPALARDVQGDQHPPGSEEGPHLGGLQSRPKKDPQNPLPE